MRNAIRFPTGNWPAREIIFPIANPDLRLERNVSNEKISRGLPLNHTFTWVENADPLSDAAEAAGAEIVANHDLRTTGATGHLEYPCLLTKFQVSEIPARRNQGDGSHDWPMGVCLGPDGGGARSNYAQSVQCTQPAGAERRHE